MTTETSKLAIQEAASSTRYETYLFSSEPVLNREEREDVILQKKLDEDTERAREIAVRNQQQLQAEFNRINRSLDAQFSALLSQTSSHLKVPQLHCPGMHGLRGTGGRALVGPQVVSSSPQEVKWSGEPAALPLGKTSTRRRRAGGCESTADRHVGGHLSSDTRELVGTSRSKGAGTSSFAYAALTGGVAPPAGPSLSSHRSSPSAKATVSGSNYAIAFPIPYEESGFQSVIRWADIAYEEAVVAALGPGADVVKIRQKEMPSRVLVTVICYLLNEILSRDSNLQELWCKFRAPLFDAVYSPQMIGAEMARRQEDALKRKTGGSQGGSSSAGGKNSIRKLLLQKDREAAKQKKVRSGFLDGMPPSSFSSPVRQTSSKKDKRGYLSSQPFERKKSGDGHGGRNEELDSDTEEEEEEEYGVFPSFPARYVQYTNQHDYASYCLWTEEMMQAKRLNKALAQRVTQLKGVVQKSRLVLDLAGHRVDRYRKQFIFAAWKTYVLYMRRCRQTATTYIVRQKNNRLLESCFLKWRRVPLQEKVSNLEAQVRDLRRKVQMAQEVHQSEIATLKAKGKAAQDMLQDLTLKDEALRNQMLESHRLETTGLQTALTKATKKAMLLRKHSRRWERLAKTSRPMVLCRSVPKPMISFAIDLRVLEEEFLSNPVPSVGCIAEAFPVLARKGITVIEQLLCRWVNFVMQSSPHHKSWAPVTECAKKLNAAPPPTGTLLLPGSLEGGGGAGVGRRGGPPSRRQSSHGSEYTEVDRLSSPLGSRRNLGSRASSSYPGMIHFPTSSAGVAPGLSAALLGPLPEASDPSQLSPHGLLLVVRELRRLLPPEVMDLQTELSLANPSGGNGPDTTFNHTMSTYVGSLETKGSKITMAQQSAIHDGDATPPVEEGDGADEEDEMNFLYPDPSHHLFRPSKLSSRASSVLYSSPVDGRLGTTHSRKGSRRQRRLGSRHRHPPRQLVSHTPPSPLTLYQELTELLHAYSAEGLFPSLLQQCPYVEFFYSPLGLAYLSNSSFYCWILAALFTGYVQKMVLMENAPSMSGATPSGVRHYLRHPQKEQQIAKNAHPSVTSTAAAEVVNIPAFLLEELEVSSASSVMAAGPSRPFYSAGARKLQSSIPALPGTSGEEAEGEAGGSYAMAKHTIVGKHALPIISFVNCPSPNKGREGSLGGVGVTIGGEITAADDVALSSDPTLSAGASSPSAVPPLFTFSSLSYYPTCGSGGSVGRHPGTTSPSAFGRMTQTLTHSGSRSGLEAGAGAASTITGPFRITQMNDVPTVREGIDTASDMSVFLGCHMEDLPDSEEDQYDVREMEMEMVKEEEALFALHRASRRSFHGGSGEGEEDDDDDAARMEWDHTVLQKIWRDEEEEVEEEKERDGEQGERSAQERYEEEGGHATAKTTTGEPGGEKTKRRANAEDDGGRPRQLPLTIPASSSSYGGRNGGGNGNERLRRAQSEHKTPKRKTLLGEQGNLSTTLNRSTHLSESKRPKPSSSSYGGSRYGQGRASSVPSLVRQLGGAGAWFPRLSLSHMENGRGGGSGLDDRDIDEGPHDSHSYDDVSPYRSGIGQFGLTKESAGGHISRKDANGKRKPTLKGRGQEEWSSSGGEGAGGMQGASSPEEPPAPPPFFWEKDDETLADIREAHKVVHALEQQMTRERKRNRAQSAAFFVDPKEDVLSVEQVHLLHLLPRPSKAFNAVVHRDQLLRVHQHTGRRRFFAAGYHRPQRSLFSPSSPKDRDEGGGVEDGNSSYPSPLLHHSHATTNEGEASSRGSFAGTSPFPKGKTAGSSPRVGFAHRLQRNGNFPSSLPPLKRVKAEKNAPHRGQGGDRLSKVNHTGAAQKGLPSPHASHRAVNRAGYSKKRGAGGKRSKEGSKGKEEEEDEDDHDDEDREDEEPEGEEGVMEGHRSLLSIPPSLRRHLERLSVLTFSKRLVRDQVHRQQWLGVARILTSLIVRIRVLDVGPGVPDRDSWQPFRLHYYGGSRSGSVVGAGDRSRMEDNGSTLSKRPRSGMGNVGSRGTDRNGVYGGPGPLPSLVRGKKGSRVQAGSPASRTPFASSPTLPRDTKPAPAREGKEEKRSLPTSPGTVPKYSSFGRRSNSETQVSNEKRGGAEGASQKKDAVTSSSLAPLLTLVSQRSPEEQGGPSRASSVPEGNAMPPVSLQAPASPAVGVKPTEHPTEGGTGGKETSLPKRKAPNTKESVSPGQPPSMPRAATESVVMPSSVNNRTTPSRTSSSPSHGVASSRSDRHVSELKEERMPFRKHKSEEKQEREGRGESRGGKPFSSDSDDPLRIPITPLPSTALLPSSFVGSMKERRAGTKQEMELFSTPLLDTLAPTVHKMTLHTERVTSSSSSSGKGLRGGSSGGAMERSVEGNRKEGGLLYSGRHSSSGVPSPYPSSLLEGGGGRYSMEPLSWYPRGEGEDSTKGSMGSLRPGSEGSGTVDAAARLPSSSSSAGSGGNSRKGNGPNVRLGTAHIPPLPLYGEGSDRQGHTMRVLSPSSRPGSREWVGPQRPASAGVGVPTPTSSSHPMDRSSPHSVPLRPTPSPTSSAPAIPNAVIGSTNGSGELGGPRLVAPPVSGREEGVKWKAGEEFSSSIPSPRTLSTSQHLLPLSSPFPSEELSGRTSHSMHAGPLTRPSLLPCGGSPSGILGSGIGGFQGEIYHGSGSGSGTNASALQLLTGSGDRHVTPAQHALDSVIIHSPVPVPRHASIQAKDRFDIRTD